MSQVFDYVIQVLYVISEYSY
ncbi:MAG: hypothetical protein Q614_SASC00343G0003, partial [Staphylococcus sp. DORA_6_22]